MRGSCDRGAQRGLQVGRQRRGVGRVVGSPAGPQQHRAPQHHPLRSVGARLGERPGEPRPLRQVVRGGRERVEPTPRVPVAAGPGGQRPHRGVEHGTAVPVISRRGDPALGVLRPQSEPAQPGAQTVTETLPRRVRCPGGSRDRLLVDVEHRLHRARPQQHPPCRRVHDLDVRPVPPPPDDEVRHPAGQHHHEQRRQVPEQHVVDGKHQLRAVQAQPGRGDLERVDGGAVHIGPAGLAQAAVADLHVEPGQQRPQGSRAAVHRRGLDRLRDDPPRGRAPHVRRRPARAPAAERGGPRRRGPPGPPRPDGRTPQPSRGRPGRPRAGPG